MTKVEVQQRRDALVNSRAQVNQRISDFDAELRALSNQRNATEGAIQDCDFWLKEIEKGEGKPGGKIPAKDVKNIIPAGGPKASNQPAKPKK